MNYSSNPKVSQFLEELEVIKPQQFEIIQKVRQIIQVESPEFDERIMYGGIMFTYAGEDFGGVFPYTNHVSLEFTHGASFDDPENLLQGSGKFRRHLKFKSVNEVHISVVKEFVHQSLNKYR